MDNKINNNPMEVSIMSERKYPVITISREFGAGGHSIARVVSERLGIPYYDRDFAKQAAARSGYSQEDIDREGENLSRSARLLDNILNNSAGYFSSHDAIYQAQKELILQFAAEQDCIIIGRCADYVLDGTENLVRLFVYAEIEERINKVREKGYFPEEDILKNIKRIDRERRDYYRYYTGKSWENLENYDLMINTTKLSYDDMVECVVDYLKMRGILAK